MTKTRSLGAAMTVLFAAAVCLLSSAALFGQSSDELNGVKVYTMEGWMVKAKNTTGNSVTYSFTYTLEGTDKDGKVVSSTEETVKNGSLSAQEERHLFTAPQDPKKEITYKITNIKLQEVKAASLARSRRR